MLANLFGKYKTLVISITLFVLLDATVLIMNFYTSFQIADDAKTVNLAGRQRMLTQRMVKSLYEIDQAISLNQAFEENLKELKQSSATFNATLQALDQGGFTPGSMDERQYLKAVTAGAGRDALNEAKQLWDNMATHITRVVNSPSLKNDDGLLKQAVAFSRENNAKLLNLMNLVTRDLENTATAKASQLRTIQAVAIVLALINFVLILRHFLGHLRRNDLALEAARKETQDILDTVNEGLFLLDRDLRMGSQHSAKLKEMFFTHSQDVNIENCLFSEFLHRIVKPNDLETAQRFVNLLFRKNIKANLIGDLNPLKQIEINLAEEGGGYTTKYMHFDFRRVLADDDIQQILVTVTDITKEVLLSKELDESKAENAQQIEMLTGILHANPRVLKLFIQNTFDTFARINDLFKSQDKTPKAIERKLRDIFVEVHNFKAEAASLNLSIVMALAHDMETAIQALLKLNNLSGSDLIPSVVLLEKLISYTEGIQALAEKVAGLSTLAHPTQAVGLNHTSGVSWHHLQELAQGLAHRHAKKVQVHLTGFNEVALHDDQVKLINDVCLQFIRNAVIHGIEKPAIRVAHGKPETGRIDLSLIQLASGGLEINVQDDGNGVDYEKIRDKAIALGLVKAEIIDQWNYKKMISLMFKPGFSTAELSDDAGRGVGMDVIVARVQHLKGNIRVISRTGKSCQFTVSLPKTLHPKIEAA